MYFNFLLKKVDFNKWKETKGLTSTKTITCNIAETETNFSSEY